MISFSIAFLTQKLIHTINILSDCNWTRTHNHLVHKQTFQKRTPNHLAKLALNYWAVLWILFCTAHLTVCSCHVTYAFQSESTLNSCLNVKEHLARHRREIWSFSDCNWVFVYELSGCGFKSSCSHLNFRFRACFKQGGPWHSGNYRVWINPETRTWHYKNTQTINT